MTDMVKNTKLPCEIMLSTCYYMLVYVIYKPLSQIVYENSNSSYIILYIYTFIT